MVFISEQVPYLKKQTNKQNFTKHTALTIQTPLEETHFSNIFGQCLPLQYLLKG